MLACVLLPDALPDAARRLFAVSPVVELRGSTAFLDVRGTSRLHGGTAGLFAALVRALAPHAPRGLGLASNRFTAEVAARVSTRLAKGALAVGPGEEALFLSRLPLAVLPMSAQLEGRLRPLGLETLGDLASLPLASVERRYGAEGVAMHRLARGEDEAGLLPEADDAPLSVLHEPEGAVPDLERLAPSLDEALASLCASLDERGLGVVRLDVELTLDDDRRERWPVQPAAPETRAELLRDLVLLALAQRPPTRPVVLLQLTVARCAAPAVHQNTLLGESARDASRRREALSRLAAVLGPGAVSRPVPRRAHRVEDRWVDVPPGVAELAAGDARAGGGAGARRSGAAARTGGRPGAPAAGGEPARATGNPLPAAATRPGSPALRWLDPPRLLVPIRGDGRLLAFRCGRAELAVAALSAPRRLEGGWWCDAWARDEYDLVTPDGGLYRICRDMAARRWLLLAEAD